MVQALAAKRLLTSFDYLSTVSGGGYLGGFLQRWLLGDPSDGRNEDGLEKRLAEGATGEEPVEITALRDGANFITPTVGFASRDTWAAIATSLRNVLINWLLFAPLFMLAAALPQLALSFLTLGHLGADIGLLLQFVMLTWAMAGTGAALPSYRARDYARNRLIRRHIVIPVSIAAFGVMMVAASPVPHHLFRDGPPMLGPAVVMVGATVFGLLVAAFVGGLREWRHRRRERAGAEKPTDPLPSPLWSTIILDLPLWLLCATASGGSILLGAGALLPAAPASEVTHTIRLATGGAAGDAASARPDAGNPLAAPPVAGSAVREAKIAAGDSTAAGDPATLLHTARTGLFRMMFLEPDEPHTPWIAAIGPAAFIFSIFVAGWLFSAFRTYPIQVANWVITRLGFRRRDGPSLKADLDREWLTRICAILLQIALVWIAIAAIALIAAGSLDWLKGLSGFIRVAGLAVAFGLVAAWVGKSVGLARQVTRLIPRDLLVGFATALFAAGAILAFSLVELWLAGWVRMQWFPKGKDWLIVESIYAHGAVALAFLILLYLMGYAIDVNRFSLLGFYRNRLARAFLGAARAGPMLEGDHALDQRNYDPFTGFDASDNARLNTIWTRSPEPRRHCLFPVINAALNIVATRRLSWQERKAQPFVFTPLACGGGSLSPSGRLEPEGAYVPTPDYGSREPDPELDGEGITLAGAMAISGAAVSPSMGYHTSAATAFLMTLFNVRLGAWLANPVRWHSSRKAKPGNSVLPLLHELTSQSTDTTAEVYVSDGGHFENLGIYEMIRRRCELIFVVDGGCDPDAHFADLGNAARKIAIDLDVRLEFEEIRIRSRKGTGGGGGVAFATASIHYPGSGVRGRLIYLKPTLLGYVPVDVMAYSKAYDAFPHEPTTDQWYAESQFESYRQLGEFLASRLDGAPAAPYDGNPGAERLTAFFDAVDAVAARTRDDAASSPFRMMAEKPDGAARNDRANPRT